MEGTHCSSMSVEAVAVKEECEWWNSAEWWEVSEAARAGLYAGHEVKRELVLGPDVLQQPKLLFTDNVTTRTDSGYSHRGSCHRDHTYAKRLPVEVFVKVERMKEEPKKPPTRVHSPPPLPDCRVRLERDLALEALLKHQARPTHGSIKKRTKREKSYVCAICRKRFARIGHLKQHVVVHIHTPKPVISMKLEGYTDRALEFEVQTASTQPSAPPPHTHTMSHTSDLRTTNTQRHTQSTSDNHTINTLDTHTTHTKSHISDTRTAHTQPRISDTRTTHTNPRTQAQIKKEKPFSCDKCNSRFTLRCNLSAHGKIHAGLKPHKCDTCDMKFRTTSHLKRHKLTHTSERPYSCDMCARKFRNLVAVRTHITNIHNDKLYSCKICSKRFGRARTLKNHMESHNTIGKPYICGICKKNFKSITCLNRHKLIHSGQRERTHACEICNKKFYYLISYQRHKLTHTGDKNFECDICNKKFLLIQTLKTHKKIHSGEKPYTCDICNWKFAFPGSLKGHKLTHKGEKIYCCDICNRRFVHISSFMRHHRLRHNNLKPFRCDVCYIRFTHLSMLKSHMLDHTINS